MIIDTRTQFASATALNTGAAGTYTLGDVIDLKASGLDIGHGEPLYLVIQVSTTATSGGSATANFTLASDSTASIATDGSASVHYTTGAIALSALTAGTMVAVAALPQGTYERYLGLLQTTGTAAFTAGKINAFLTLDPPKWKAYPDGI